MRGPRNSRLDLGGDPDKDLDPGIFKGDMYSRLY